MNDALFERYLRDQMSAADVAELKALLAPGNEAGRRAFMAFVQEWGLTASVAFHTTEAFRATSDGLPWKTAPMETALCEQAGSSPSWKTWALAACAALLAGGCFLFFSLRPAEIATLLATRPGVTIERSHDTIHVVQSKSLRAGDTVRVGPGAGAVIRYADSTQMEIRADSVLTLKTPEGRAPAEVAEGTRGGRWAGEPRSPVSGRRKAEGKRVEFRQGSLSANVAKQPPGQPMIFVTPTAEATVVGTQLQIQVDETSTQLAVEEGAVRLRRLADDQAVTVSKGEQVVAGREATAALNTTPIEGAATNKLTGVTTLYSNDMETAATYNEGVDGAGTLTTAQKHGGLKSEQLAADDVGRWSNIFKPLPTAPVKSAVYRLWLFDNDNATQTYRLGLIFGKPDPAETAQAENDSDYIFAADAGWTQFSYDLTDVINTRIREGYTVIKTIMIWAHNSESYVPYSIDDVVVEYLDQPQAGAVK